MDHEEMRNAVYKAMSESDFQARVIGLARQMGWLVFHPSPHMAGTIWRTDGRGFPDLVMVHKEGGLIFAELKAMSGRLTEDQKDWGNLISEHAEYHVWRPSDLPEIERRLVIR